MTASASAKLHRENGSTHINVRVVETIKSPKGHSYPVEHEFCLSLVEAERLIQSLFSCVDTLKGVNRPLSRRERASKALRSLRGTPGS